MSLPDLTAGIRLNELMEGEPFHGHIGDDAAMVIRYGDDVHAFASTCTHYGGPLAEGLVTGDLVRCPWHHACFSLRTGEAVAAPALNPLARWKVEVREGVAYVGERIEDDPLAARGRRADGPASIVIIGGGAAGSAAAEMARREGYAGAITIIDPDRDAPYDRPNLSKDYLAGHAPEEWIPLRPPGFYEQHGITRVHARATRIDTKKQRVTLDSGDDLAYGALLLATGAAPIRLSIPGADLPHVHVLRSFADCRAIIESLSDAQPVVIAGASFIGMEVAASLRQRGHSVGVVAPETVPFEKTLGAQLGELLREEHERNGVAFRLGHTLQSISDTAVTLDDGTVLPAAVVVIGIGVRPLTTLAEDAGIACDRGVLVDEYLRTSAPYVYAAGDSARFVDPRSGERIRIEHWVVAQRQGQTAGRNLLGAREPYTSVPFFWTRQFDVGINYVGHAASWDRVDIDGNLAERDATVSFRRGGQTLAVATVNRDLDSLRSETLLLDFETG